VHYVLFWGKTVLVAWCCICGVTCRTEASHASKAAAQCSSSLDWLSRGCCSAVKWRRSSAVLLLVEPVSVITRRMRCPQTPSDYRKFGQEIASQHGRHGRTTSTSSGVCLWNRQNHTPPRIPTKTAYEELSVSMFNSLMPSHTIVAVARSRCPEYPGAPLLRPPPMPPRHQPATPPTWNSSLVQWEPVKYKKLSGEAAAWPEVGPLWLRRQPNAILRYLLTARAKARGWADRLPQLSYYDSMRVPPCINPGRNPKTCLFYGGELAPSGPACSPGMVP